MPGGRPPKYKKSYAKKIIEYFSVQPTKTVTEKYFYKNGEVKEREVPIANDFPTFEGFAISIGVIRETLSEWANIRYPLDYEVESLRGELKYPEFSEAHARARQMQENFWLVNSMSGRFNPQFAIFIGKNIFDGRYSDKSQIDANVQGKIVNLSVVSYDDAAKELQEIQKAALPAPKSK